MSVIQSFFNFIPSIVQAVLILVIAWLMAVILRAAVKKILNRLFGSKIKSDAGEVKDSYAETITIAGNITFAVVFFLFLPSAFEKLGMGSVTAPIYSVVSIFLAFLPRLIACGILIAFGAFLSKLVSQLIDKALKATPLDNLQKKGNQVVKQGYEISAVIAKIAYALIIVLFVVAGIEVLGISAITVPATRFVQMIFEYIPLLFVGIVLIVFGIFIGKIVGNLLENILAGTGLDKFSKETYQKNNGNAVPASKIIAGLTTTVIDIIFVVSGIKVLKIDVLTNVGNTIIGYLPSLLAACLIVLAAWAAASWLQRSILKTYPDAKALAMIVRVVVLLLAGFMALVQLGISEKIVETLFTWLCIGLAASFAIAFGMGGQEWAKKRLDDITKSTEEQTKNKEN